MITLLSAPYEVSAPRAPPPKLELGWGLTLKTSNPAFAVLGSSFLQLAPINEAAERFLLESQGRAIAIDDFGAAALAVVS